MIASITDGLVRTKQVYVTFASLVIGKTRKMEIFAKNVAVVKQVLLVQLLWSIVIATMAGVGKHQRILVLPKAYVYLVPLGFILHLRRQKEHASFVMQVHIIVWTDKQYVRIVMLDTLRICLEGLLVTNVVLENIPITLIVLIG